MKLTQFTVARQDTGAPLPGAQVTVYVTGTTTPASLYDETGAAISNPCTADAIGLVKFKTDDGTYDIVAVSADGSYNVPPILQFQIVDLVNIRGTITSGRIVASTWAELSPQTPANGTVAEIPPTDTGTHTDPVTSATNTPNSGVYRRESGGWRWMYTLNSAGSIMFDSTRTVADMIKRGFSAGPIAQRPAAGSDYPNGFSYYSTDENPPREYVLVKSGSRDPSGTVAGADTWYARKSVPEQDAAAISASERAAVAQAVTISLIETDAFVVAQVDVNGRLLAKQDLSGVWSGTNYASGITPYPPIYIETDVFSVAYVDENYREIKIVDKYTAPVVTPTYDPQNFSTDAFLIGWVSEDGRKVLAFEKDQNNFVKYRDSSIATPSFSYTVQPAYVNSEALSGWRSALLRLKRGGSGLAHCMVSADSWMDAKTYGIQDAVTQFYARTGLTDAGYGLIGLASPVTSSFSPHLDARASVSVSRSGSWQDLFRSADGTPGTIQNYPGYDAAQSLADGSVYIISGSRLSSSVYLRLFCSKGGGIEYSWDGGTTYTALTVPAGSGSTYVDVPLTGATTSLRLRCANGTQISSLMHLTSLSGVVFSVMACSGSTAAQQASVQSNADYITTMRALPGDFILAYPQLGLNDTKVSTPPATIQSNVALVANGFRSIYAGYPYCDVLVGCQPNTPLSVQDTLAPLLRSWSLANDAAFLDWQIYYGVPTYSGDYSSYNRDYTSGAASTARPLLQQSSGFRHPSRSADLIAAGKSSLLNGADMTAEVLAEIFAAGV